MFVQWNKKAFAAFTIRECVRSESEVSVILQRHIGILNDDEILFYVCKHSGEHKNLLLRQINVWPPLSLTHVCGYLSKLTAPGRDFGLLRSRVSSIYSNLQTNKLHNHRRMICSRRRCFFWRVGLRMFGHTLWKIFDRLNQNRVSKFLRVSF